MSRTRSAPSPQGRAGAAAARRADGSGAWGSSSPSSSKATAMFGRKAAIAALEEGEDHGRDDYRSDLSGLSLDVRRLVEPAPAEADADARHPVEPQAGVQA
ncbi:MAG: hypothetical protein R2862_01075 [Thermoanaerobaculia bacterium]